MPGILLDENLPIIITAQLRRHAPHIHVLRVGESPAPTKGTLDPKLLLWLEMNNCWLVTNNRASMPGHLTDHIKAGHAMPGVFIVREPSQIGKLITELILIWGASFANEYQDRIVYLPLSRP